MLKMTNDLIGLSISLDGQDIQIEDRRRAASWRLDTAAWGFVPSKLTEALTAPVKYEFCPFPRGQAVSVSHRQL